MTEEPRDEERAARDEERSGEAHWKVAEAGAAEYDDAPEGQRQAEDGTAGEPRDR